MKLSILWRVQRPAAENGFTSGYRSLFHIGGLPKHDKTSHKLWNWQIRHLDLINLRLNFEWGPQFYPVALDGR